MGGAGMCWSKDNAGVIVNDKGEMKGSAIQADLNKRHASQPSSKSIRS